MSETAIKKAIHDARIDGDPICSGVEGYWISEDINEQAFFVRSMEKHAISTLKCIKSMRRRVKQEIKGQITLFDIEDI